MPAIPCELVASPPTNPVRVRWFGYETHRMPEPRQNPDALVEIEYFFIYRLNISISSVS